MKIIVWAKITVPVVGSEEREMAKEVYNDSDLIEIANDEIRMVFSENHPEASSIEIETELIESGSDQ